MYISGFFWKSSSTEEVTARLVNGYIIRAISQFCDMLSYTSFIAPSFQSRKTQIDSFTYSTSRNTTCRLLVHLFRSADTVRCFKLELDLCPEPTPGMLNLFFFPFFVILISLVFISRCLFACLSSTFKSWEPGIHRFTLCRWRNCQSSKWTGLDAWYLLYIYSYRFLRVTTVIHRWPVITLDPIPSQLHRVTRL